MTPFQQRIFVSALTDELEKIGAWTTDLLEGFIRSGGHTTVHTLPEPMRAVASRLPAGTINGRPFINPPALARNAERLTGQPLSTEGLQATSALAGVHERFETGTRAVSEPFRARLGHRGPGVLAKERRAAMRLEGPGAEEARTTIRRMRQRTGEYDVMRDLVGRVFKDPRAVGMWERGEVSGAMRRKLERDSAANPEMVEAALQRVRQRRGE